MASEATGQSETRFPCLLILTDEPIGDKETVEEFYRRLYREGKAIVVTKEEIKE